MCVTLQQNTNWCHAVTVRVPANPQFPKGGKTPEQTTQWTARWAPRFTVQCQQGRGAIVVLLLSIAICNCTRPLSLITCVQQPKNSLLPLLTFDRFF